jgi:hypothetical protein
VFIVLKPVRSTAERKLKNYADGCGNIHETGTV